MVAIILYVEEITEYLYQKEACFRLTSRDI